MTFNENRWGTDFELHDFDQDGTPEIVLRNSGRSTFQTEIYRIGTGSLDKLLTIEGGEYSSGDEKHITPTGYELEKDQVILNVSDYDGKNSTVIKIFKYIQGEFKVSFELDPANFNKSRE